MAVSGKTDGKVQPWQAGPRCLSQHCVVWWIAAGSAPGICFLPSSLAQSARGKSGPQTAGTHMTEHSATRTSSQT